MSIQNVYMVFEIPPGDEERFSIHGCFVDLSMAIEMLRVVLTKFETGRKVFYSYAEDIIRVELEGGNESGTIVVLEKVPLTHPPTVTE